jgi:hypothetical protein
MSQIEVTEAYPRCRKVTGDDATTCDMPLALHEIAMHIATGYDIGIYVDGWERPWRCFLDGRNHLRAECPTSCKVVPLVVQVSRDGAVYTGCDCACHGEVEDVLRDHK